MRRCPRLEDAHAVTDLINACRQEVLGKPTQTLQDTLARWAHPEFNLEQDAWLIEESGQVIAFFAVFDFAPHNDPACLGFVHPQHRGRGLGTQGLQLIEARARQAIPLAPEGALVALEAWLLQQDAPAASLLQKHDFKLLRHFLRMRRDLTLPIPEPQLPPGMSIQVLEPTEANFRRIHAASEEAFIDHYGRMPISFESWMAFYTSRAEVFDPHLFFVALDGDEIAGACLNLTMFEEPTQGYVDDLAVRRPWRRQGVALALLHQTFLAFQQRGSSHVALTVDGSSLTGATRLYEKAGMVTVQQMDMYEKVLRPGKDLREREITEGG